MKSKAVLSGVLSKKFLSRRRIEPVPSSGAVGCLPNDSGSFLDDSKRSANRSVKSKNTFSFFSRSSNHKATADGKHSAATRAVLTWQSPARKFVMKMKERRQPVSARLDKVGKGEKKINFSVDLSEIFFLGRPQLFFQAVEISILMNSLYLSIWFCNYMTRMNAELDVSYLMLIPIIVCFPVIGEIVKIASMIDCTAKLNLDVVGQILEDIEERSQLKKGIQERLKLLPMNEDTCMATVNKLFSDLASPDNPNEIGEEDFREILKSLKIYFR